METVETDEGMLPLSEKYYLTNNKSCSQVPVRADGSSTEYPYDLSKMVVCEQTGDHPHFGAIRGRTRKAK